MPTPVSRTVIAIRYLLSCEDIFPDSVSVPIAVDYLLGILPMSLPAADAFVPVVVDLVDVCLLVDSPPKLP